MSGRVCALPAIALCFFGSAVIRGEVLAEGAGAAMADKPRQMAAVSHPDPVEPGAISDPCATRTFIDRLEAREKSLVERESALNARAARLSVVGDRVAAMTEALEQAKSDLAATVQRVDGAQERDIAHLVTMYSTMKPKRAGELFDEMDVSFASELLVRTKAETAALILANMESKKAFTISVMIAQRNRYAPKD